MLWTTLACPRCPELLLGLPWHMMATQHNPWGPASQWRGLTGLSSPGLTALVLSAVIKVVPGVLHWSFLAVCPVACMDSFLALNILAYRRCQVLALIFSPSLLEGSVPSQLSSLRNPETLPIVWVPEHTWACLSQSLGSPIGITGLWLGSATDPWTLPRWGSCLCKQSNAFPVASIEQWLALGSWKTPMGHICMLGQRVGIWIDENLKGALPFSWIGIVKYASFRSTLVIQTPAFSRSFRLCTRKFALFFVLELTDSVLGKAIRLEFQTRCTKTPQLSSFRIQQNFFPDEATSWIQASTISGRNVFTELLLTN